MGSARSRLEFLDLARIIAIVAVVACHWLNAFTGEVYPYLATLGNVTFFAVSGAGLAYAYGKPGKFEVIPFYRKRIVSTIPIFYIAFIFGFFGNFVINQGLATNVPTWAIVYSFLGIDGLVLAAGIPTFYTLGEWFLGAILVIWLLFPVIRAIYIRSKWVLGGSVFALVVWAAFDSGLDWRFASLAVLPIASFIFGMLAVRSPNLWGMLVFGGISISVYVLQPDINSTISNLLIGFGSSYAVFWLGKHVTKWQGVTRLIPVMKPYVWPVVLVHHALIFWMLTVWFNPMGGPRRNVVVFVLLASFLTICLSALLLKAEAMVLRAFRKPRIASVT